MSAEEIRRLDRLAVLLDSQFRLPGTGFRFGLDTVVGLIPGLGDAVTFVPSAYLILTGLRLGARKSTIARMAGNTAIDLLIGAVPLLGDLFDAAFKANLRNVRLLREDLARQQTAQAAPSPSAFAA